VNHIREFRLAKGWSQYELARRAGFASDKSVWKIEAGVSDNSFPARRKIAAALDQPLEALFPDPPRHWGDEYATTNRVREFRERAGLTVNELKERAGLRYPSIVSNIEHGRNGGRAEVRSALAEALDVAEEVLFPDSVGKRRGPLCLRRLKIEREPPPPQPARGRRSPCPFCGESCYPDERYAPPNGKGRYPWYHSQECYEIEITTQQYAAVGSGAVGYGPARHGMAGLGEVG